MNDVHRRRLAEWDATLAEFRAETARMSESLITIRDPEVLKKYGWKAPYPSSVTAAPSLWELWLHLPAR